MRSTKLVLTFLALSVAASAQQPARTRAKAAPVSQPAPTDAERQKLHDAAMKFVEASDARKRLEQSLDKLLEDGKQSMMLKNPGLAPQFGDEWIKRMHQRVSLDQFVITTAQVYEKYFTTEELNQLTWGQLAIRNGGIYTFPDELTRKLKSNSANIQQEINRSTSLIGGRLGAEVGREIEKDHPEWITKLNASTPPAHK